MMGVFAIVIVLLFDMNQGHKKLLVDWWNGNE